MSARIASSTMLGTLVVLDARFVTLFADGFLRLLQVRPISPMESAKRVGKSDLTVALASKFLMSRNKMGGELLTDLNLLR
jgi:hypothetical protein